VGLAYNAPEPTRDEKISQAKFSQSLHQLLLDLCNLDHESGHTAYRQVSLTGFYHINTKFLSVSNQKNFARFDWLIDWLSMVLCLRQHNIGYTADGFYRSDDPTNSVKALKEGG